MTRKERYLMERMESYVYRLILLAFVQTVIVRGGLPETAHLLRAISDGDIEKVKQVFMRNPGSMLERDADNNGPLHQACQSAGTQDDPSILWYLLTNGADAHSKNVFQQTPLHFTVYITNPEKRMPYITALIKHGADINARDDEGNTVLDKYVIERNQLACGLFLDCFGDIIAPEVLVHAKKLAGKEAGEGFGFTDIYDELAKKRTVSFDQSGYCGCTGMTRLMHATLAGNSAAVEQLAKATGVIDQRSRDQWGYSALDLAILQNRLSLVEVLIKCGARHDQKNKRGLYPMGLAENIGNQLIKSRIINMLKVH